MTGDQAGSPPDVWTLTAVLRYLDGHGSPEEVAALVERLRADPANRRNVARLLLSLGHLHDIGCEQRSGSADARGTLAAPLQQASARLVTDAGWKLFEAAVRWALQPVVFGP